MEYFEMAIKMEVDGEKFYKEQANKNQDNATYQIFTYLAQEEQKHARLIEKMQKKLSIDPTPEIDLTEYKHPFQELKDFQLDIKTIPEQLDVYRLALEMEKKSIDFYQDILTKTKNPEGKKIINFLILQEKSHYKIFEGIIEHVLRAEEWVEDAEFGLRKPY
ncbi:MAG: ferritin family protein [Clostridia bacterium]|jgi:rubrerythrin|nr:ferritin family protein [Clostridia bacterium]